MVKYACQNVLVCMFACISNCSLDQCQIGPEGGVALGKALTVNQMVKRLR